MNESLLRFNKKQRYVVFDTETEGLNLITSRPWQVAWMVVEGDSVIEKNDLFIEWPDLEVSEGAAKITGFTEKEYNKRCEPPKQVWDKFSKELLTPVRAGEGSFLYTLATGLKITPSKTWLNLNVALLIVSKQSFISEGSFFLSNNSPSDAALTLVFKVNARVVIAISVIFFNIVTLILYKLLK